MKFEVIITVWKDGLFKMRDRIESDSIESLEEQFEFVVNDISSRIVGEDEERKYLMGDDDDIPF